MTSREFWRLVERESIRVTEHDQETGEATGTTRTGAVVRVLPHLPGLRVVDGKSAPPASW